MRETINKTHYEYLLKLCLGLDYIIGLIFGTKKTLFIFALQKARKGSSLFFETIFFLIYSLILFKIICFIFVKHL